MAPTWEGFRNYGYQPLAADEKPPVLEPADEVNRYCIQLYHHVTEPVDLAGRDVLEVSSGRGGGADYLHRYRQPRSLVGADLSSRTVKLCNHFYGSDTLSFVEADAESLPFEDSRFDAVVNVEASHCYGCMRAFLGEVKRVLRPGGHLLLADLRKSHEVEALQRDLAECGMSLLQQREITANVRRALELDTDHRLQAVGRFKYRSLRKLFRTFAGVTGSEVYRAFESGELVYQSFVLQKP